MRAPLPSFDAIYHEFRPKVLRYMVGVVDPQEAPDLAQIALMKVAENLRNFRGESSLSTWIYRIAANVALDRLRQRAADRVTCAAEIDPGDEAIGESVPPELQSPSAESVAERGEMSACVREFVDRLPLNYRSVIVLSEVEGFSNAEIAEILGCTVDTVKIRLHRGRARLRAELMNGCTVGRGAGNEIACERAIPFTSNSAPYPFERFLRPKG